LVILLGHKFWRTVDYMDASKKIRNDFWVWNGKKFARLSSNGEWLVRWRLSVSTDSTVGVIQWNGFFSDEVTNAKKVCERKMGTKFKQVMKKKKKETILLYSFKRK
jgi:hypothetical protein